MGTKFTVRNFSKTTEYILKLYSNCKLFEYQMNIQALIILLVVVVTIIRATPINDGDAAVGFEKEQQVVDSVMGSRSNVGMK